jgi:hypothetical protein
MVWSKGSCFAQAHRTGRVPNMVAGQADWDQRVESDSYCHVFHASGKLFSVIIPGLPLSASFLK